MGTKDSSRALINRFEMILIFLRLYYVWQNRVILRDWRRWCLDLSIGQQPSRKLGFMALLPLLSQLSYLQTQRLRDCQTLREKANHWEFKFDLKKYNNVWVAKKTFLCVLISRCPWLLYAQYNPRVNLLHDQTGAVCSSSILLFHNSFCVHTM